MASSTIDQLIINSPYEEPHEHWSYERESRKFTRKPGRRPAGYVTATPGAKAFDDPGIFRELPLVNQIRPRIRDWRDADYPRNSAAEMYDSNPPRFSIPFLNIDTRRIR